MQFSFFNIFDKWFISLGIESEYATLLASVLSFVLVLVTAVIAYQILNRVVIKNLKKLTEKTKVEWDNVFFEMKVFKWLSHLIPAFIIYFGAAASLDPFPDAVTFFQRASNLYMAITGILVIEAVINSLHQIYNLLSVSKNRSIKGYVQVIKIFLYILGTGIVLSILYRKTSQPFLPV